MIRLVVSNQRGGVAKTTTALTLARLWADQGKRVLLVDTDPQGSVHTIIGIKPERFLKDFLVDKIRLPDCVVKATDRLHILASGRSTSEAEAAVFGQVGRDMVFDASLTVYDNDYDVVLIDCAPSVSLFQTCAMIYARKTIIPIAMDSLSVQGALGSLAACEHINRMYSRIVSLTPVKPCALLPVMVNRRFSLTDLVLDSVKEISERFHIPVLSAVRTDQTVAKAAKARQFLVDFDPHCKALEDYTVVAGELLEVLGGEDKHAEHAPLQVQT